MLYMKCILIINLIISNILNGYVNINKVIINNKKIKNNKEDDMEVVIIKKKIENKYWKTYKDTKIKTESPKSIKKKEEIINSIFEGILNREEDKKREERYELFKRSNEKSKKSENFIVQTNITTNFTDIGGYDNVKLELKQCLDILKNPNKYSKYNVRTPKGILFEGPPGNGKTLFAKAIAGECGNIGYIAVSGSEFQEKYVGVGASKVRELFNLARNNIPCIVFIDEIDAIGRKRSNDGEMSSSEKDNTLNELLIALDGFKSNDGVFLIGATNRIDLLDNALIRPKRIDKKIYIGLPDEKTREHIIEIHKKGKPIESIITKEDLLYQTEGLSCAQIENLLNEAMLNALLNERERITQNDIQIVLNKMLVGWQPNPHKYTEETMERIFIHEMGHAIVGFYSPNHSKLIKIIVNLHSPTSPAYTIFENPISNIYTNQSLIEHLSVLVAGRKAEEIFYNNCPTIGAINDLEEAKKLSEKMILIYGLGTNCIISHNSEKYKEIIDNQINILINNAVIRAEEILNNNIELIKKGIIILKEKGVLFEKDLYNLK